MSDIDVSGIYHLGGDASYAEQKAARAEEQLAYAQRSLARSQLLVQSLEESIRIANRHILEVAAERTAFHDLAQAMVYELHGDPAGRDLTIPDNKDGRRAFFEKRKAEVAEASEAANANAKYI
jgi:hypothetical protein